MTVKERIQELVNEREEKLIDYKRYCLDETDWMIGRLNKVLNDLRDLTDPLDIYKCIITLRDTFDGCGYHIGKEEVNRHIEEIRKITSLISTLKELE